MLNVIICKYNNSSYHRLITRMQYICSHMTGMLLTFMLKHFINMFFFFVFFFFFFNFYQDKFADRDAGLLKKWEERSRMVSYEWQINNKHTQKQFTCKTSKGSNVYMHSPYNCKISIVP